MRFAQILGRFYGQISSDSLMISWLIGKGPQQFNISKQTSNNIDFTSKDFQKASLKKSNIANINLVTLRIMGSQNWWFGDPRTLLYTSKPVFRRVQWFLKQIKTSDIDQNPKQKSLLWVSWGGDFYTWFNSLESAEFVLECIFGGHNSQKKHLAIDFQEWY